MVIMPELAAALQPKNGTSYDGNAALNNYRTTIREAWLLFAPG
jgi:hypothetical protein